MAAVHDAVQSLHLVFGLFYALLEVAAFRGVSLYVLDLWRKMADRKLAYENPA